MEQEERTWKEYLEAGESAIDSCDFEAARKHLLTALEALEDAGEGGLADLAAVTRQLGYAEWFAGNYAAAEESFGRLIAMQEGLCGPDSLELSETLRDLAQVYIESDDLTKAEELLVRQAGILQPRMHELRRGFAEALDALAHVEHGLGKLGGAIVHAKEAIEIIQSIEGPDSLGLVEPLRTYLLVLEAMATERHPSPERTAEPRRTSRKQQPEA